MSDLAFTVGVGKHSVLGYVLVLNNVCHTDSWIERMLQIVVRSCGSLHESDAVLKRVECSLNM